MFSPMLFTLLAVTLVAINARPQYVSCLGRFQGGPCNGQGVNTCTGDVMGSPILALAGASISGTTVAQGASLIITPPSNTIRTAWAERGVFPLEAGNAFGGSCTTETRAFRNGALGTSIEWVAPNDYTGDVTIVIVSNNGNKAQISRAIFTVTVFAVPTAAPTEAIDIDIEWQGTQVITRNGASLGDSIVVNNNDQAGLFLHKFTPQGAVNPTIEPADECTTFGEDRLTGVRAGFLSTFYHGILGQDDFDTDFTTEPGSATQFDDLLFGNGTGTYEFIKKDCRTGAVSSCCSLGGSNAKLTITVETVAPTGSPSLPPTPAPTNAFVVAELTWALDNGQYVGPQSITVQPGDVLRFNVLDLNHNIVEVPTKAEFDNCDHSNAVLIREILLQDIDPNDPEDVTIGVETVGLTRWFTCNRTAANPALSHCDLGQRIAVKVVAVEEETEVTWVAANNYGAGLDLEPNSNILFRYTQSNHTVMKMPTKESFDACDKPQGEILTENEFAGGNRIRVGDTPGTTEWYICSVGGHCAGGQKIAVRIAAAEVPEDPFELELLPILSISTALGMATAAVIVFVFPKRDSSLRDPYSLNIGVMNAVSMSEDDESLSKLRETIEPGGLGTGRVESTNPRSTSRTAGSPRYPIDSDLKF